MPDDVNDGGEAEVNENFSTADAPGDEQGDAPEIETLADLIEASAWDIEGTRGAILLRAGMRIGVEDWTEFAARVQIRRNEIGAAAFDFLVERTRTDRGAPLTPRMVASLRELRSGNAGEFERLRERLKDAGCRVGALDREMNRGSGFAHQRGPNAEQEAGTDNWPGMCDVNKQGDLLCNLRNALIALRNAPDLINLFAFDQMLQEAVARVGDTWKPPSDQHMGEVQEKLQEKGLKMLGPDTAFQAMRQRASERPFHPVRDYLRGLVWDSVTRLDSWLETYCRAEVTDTNQEYLRIVGRTFFLSLVARVMRPGCKVDHMLILEGAQGLRKSTVAEIIGGPWFSDSMPSITVGKDAQIHLRGKWLIELGELAAMSRAEAGQLKQFLTVTTDRYRPPYGRAEIEYARQCVFIGTTNEDHYLRDATGARRFFPVKIVGPCDTDRLRADRDQLFAEAFHRFQQGEKWWPDDAFQIGHAHEQQSSRFDADIWEPKIEEWLRGKTSVTAASVLTEGLNVRMDQLTETMQKRVQKTLRRLGWEPGKFVNRKRAWVPGPRWQPLEDEDQIPF